MKRLAVVARAAACGGSTPHSNATISITAPTANASVLLGSDAAKSVTITYTLTGFTVKAPGTCAGASNCGHVHVLIDGQACNAPGSPYNNTSIDQSSAQAQFASCAAANQVGTHTVTLELHDDQHNPVLDASGHQIMSAVSFSTHL